MAECGQVPLILLISLNTLAAFAGEISEFSPQNQFIGAACNLKRWPRLLAQRTFVRLPLHRRK